MPIILALALAATAFASPGVRAAAQAPDLMRQLRETFPGGVTVFRDVPYRVLSGYHPLTADVYVPAAGKGPYPAVVYGHGGGWAFGSPRDPGTPELLSALATRGYVVMAINYRFSGEAKFPGAVKDAKAAVRWIRSNAAVYGADPARVAMWGVSAGGYLAVMVGTSCGEPAFEPEPNAQPPVAAGGVAVKTDPTQSDCVQAVVDWFAPVDFATMDSQAIPDSRKHSAPGSSESALLGCALPDCPSDLLVQADAAHYADASDPPFLIQHGDFDHSVPLGQSQELYDALNRAGMKAQLMIVPGADHIWVGATDVQKRQIRATAFAFLDSVFAKP